MKIVLKIGLVIVLLLICFGFFHCYSKESRTLISRRIIKGDASQLTNIEDINRIVQFTDEGNAAKLREYLKNKDEYIRNAAALMLAELDDTSGVPELLKMLEYRYISYAPFSDTLGELSEAGFPSDIYGYSDVAEKAIMKLGKTSLPALMDIIRNESLIEEYSYSWENALCYGLLFGVNKKELFLAMIEHLGSDVKRVREVAEDRLMYSVLYASSNYDTWKKKIDPGPLFNLLDEKTTQEIMPILIAYMNNPSMQERAYAMSEMVCKRMGAAKKIIIEHLNSNDPIKRSNAVRLLPIIEQEPALSSHLTELLDDNSVMVRAASIDTFTNPKVDVDRWRYRNREEEFKVLIHKLYGMLDDVEKFEEPMFFNDGHIQTNTIQETLCDVLPKYISIKVDSDVSDSNIELRVEKWKKFFEKYYLSKHLPKVPFTIHKQKKGDSPSKEDRALVKNKSDRRISMC